MKSVNKILIIGILAMFLLATAAPALEIKSKTLNEEIIVLDFSFSEPQLEKISVKDGIYDRISVDGLPNINDFREPRLPVKPLRILLPQGRSMENIEVFTSDKISLGKGYDVELGAKVVPLVTTQQITKKQSSNAIKPLKSTSDIAPEPLYSDVAVYTSRGFSILHINLHPIQYLPETGEIFYYDHMTLLVETKESSVNGAFRDLPKDYAHVENLVENPSDIYSYKSSSVEKSLSTETYDYVIITSEELKNSDGEYTFQDLMDHKLSKGLNPTIVTIEEILSNSDYEAFGAWGDANPSNPFYGSEITGNLELFDDAPAKIRNFIRHAYMDWGTDYVLLGGDADAIVEADNIVPLRGLFADEDGLPLNVGSLDHEEDDIPSDVYYACLDGNFNYDCDMHFGEAKNFNDADEEIDEADLYAEVWVGRACADSAEEISNFVKKTLWYEETNDLYFSEILFIGEYLGFPGVSEYGGNYKDHTEEVVDIPDIFNISKIYDRDETWYADFMITHLSETSYHLINHDGHGMNDYMLKTSGENIRLLTNEKPFFIYSHSCLTGSFDNYNCWYGYQTHDCIAEILTCEIPYGAFACILNARYGLGSEDSVESPSGAYDESFYEALFEENIRELGGANHYSKQDNVWRIDENGMRWCYYQTNLFGDPELGIKDPANISPDVPDRPSGPTTGKPDVEYTYTTRTIDPNGGQVYYWFDWGDDTNGEWIGPYESGEEASAKHIWDEKGSYQIKVKAKNTAEIQSEWSESLPISMPKNRALFDNLLLNLLEKFLHGFPLLSSLLEV